MFLPVIIGFVFPGSKERNSEISGKFDSREVGC